MEEKMKNLFRKLLLPLVLLAGTLGFAQILTPPTNPDNPAPLAQPPVQPLTQVGGGSPGFIGPQAAPQSFEVSLKDLNVHLSIPITHKMGIGSDFTLTLSFNNDFWTPPSGLNGYNWQVGVPLIGLTASYGDYGWSINSTSGYMMGSACTDIGNNPEPMGYTGYMDPTGNVHPLFLGNGTGGSQNYPAVYVGVGSGGANSTCPYVDHTSIVLPDNSGITVNLVSTGNNTAVFPDGTVVTMEGIVVPSTNTSVDTNGNTVSFSITSTSGTYTDTLNTNPVVTRGTSTSNVYTYPTAAGNETFTLNYTATPIMVGMPRRSCHVGNRVE